MSQFSLLFKNLNRSQNSWNTFLRSQRGGGYSLPELRYLYRQRGGLKKTTTATTTKKTTKTTPNVIEQDIKVGDLNVKFVFVPSETKVTDVPQLAAFLEKTLKKLDDESKKALFKDLETGKNVFKSLAIVETPEGSELAGYASGKYNKGMFDFAKVTTEGFLRSSEIKWIEILRKFRGKKLCQAFMEFLLATLYNAGVDNVKVDNVGGLAACICYLKAAKKFDADGFFAVDPRSVLESWYPIDVKECEKHHANLNYIFFPRDTTVKMHYKPED